MESVNKNFNNKHLTYTTTPSTQNAFVNDSMNKINSLLISVEKMYINNLALVNFQMIYSKCHELCQNRLSDDLFTRFIHLVETIVTTYANNLNLIQLDHTDQFMLYLVDSFIHFNSVSQTVADSLLYLERVRQKNGMSVIGIFDSCMEKFYNAILFNKNITTKIFFLLSKELKRVRGENYENIHNFQILLEIFTHFKKSYCITTAIDGLNNDVLCTEITNIYSNGFINLLEKKTETFYVNFLHDHYTVVNIEEEEELNSYNVENENIKICTNLIETIFNILENEDKLFSVLPQCEREKIIIILIDNLLLKNSSFLFNNGFKYFFSINSFDFLTLIYKLYFYTEYPIIRNKFYHCFGDFILNTLRHLENNFVKKNNFNKIDYFNFHQYIEEIFQLKKKFLNLLINSFDNSTKLEHIIKSNFEKLVNKHEDFLENFVQLAHEEIKISIKTRSSKVQEFADKFLLIFKLINDKDLFEIEYRKYLSKRLIRNSSMIRETEYDFYSIMKKESGSIYVKKIENMINDIFYSHDMNLEYKIKQKKVESNFGKSKVDFNVKVLSNENWPFDGVNTNNKNGNGNIEFQNILSINIPNILDKNITDFTNFYHAKFKNRQLLWVYDLSWAEVTAKFNHNNYNFIVSTFQMAIMIFFNKRRFCTLSDLTLSLNINNAEKEKYQTFLNHLIPLIKCKLLIITSPESMNNISYNDQIKLNEEFTNKNHKIILNNLKKDKKENCVLKEEKEVSHLVLEDRKHHIESAIMRVLKQNKQIHFDNLKIKIIEYVSNYFVPEISLIKQRLDNLLDREFIARDVNDPHIYNYIL